MRITVFGLWHLGSVTAACLAAEGHRIVGLDDDPNVVRRLADGHAPLFEPGLDALIQEGLASGGLSFSNEPREALDGAELVWVAFDTPVDENDVADVDSVRRRLESIRDFVPRGALVLVSSQVPVGFTRALSRDWSGRGLRFAYSPENLRLGKALDAFRGPERVIVGLGNSSDREALAPLFAPFTSRIEWMTIESAEMTKHALNAFLATSVTFINELARLCEAVGADAKEVERGLKSEGRIGPKAYLAPGAAFAGGTLARDVRFLVDFGSRLQVGTPLFQGVLDSNELHKGWMREKVAELLDGVEHPVATVLGLTYKPGTSTLRRSASVELCIWLHGRGVTVRAHDPAVTDLPPELASTIDLASTPRAALAGSDVAVVATEWPDFRSLSPADFHESMRRPRIIDQSWFLGGTLAGDTRLTYLAPGKPHTAARGREGNG